MGWYFRKSMKLGPFRLSASKSGLNVSAGIRGLRMGIGPRGQYVAAGRGGIYYRQYSSGAKRQSIQSNNLPLQRKPTSEPMEAVDVAEGTVIIDSADTLTIRDDTADGLLDELNAKQRRPMYSKWFLVLWFIALFGLGSITNETAKQIVPVVMILVAPVIGIGLYWWDRRSKRTYMIFDLTEDYEVAYKVLYEALSELGKARKMWYIKTQKDIDTAEAKYQAGAGALVTRNKTNVVEKKPPGIKTNVNCLRINVGKEDLFFMPDRLLIFGKKGVGAVGYHKLRFEVDTQRFIETERVPKDAKIVDTTWLYTNKKGGPDKRFKDNRELPVCQYEKISLTSDTGLNEQLNLSRLGFGEKVNTALASFAASVTAKEKPKGSESIER